MTMKELIKTLIVAVVLVCISCKDGKGPTVDIRLQKEFLIVTDTFASGALKIKGSLDQEKKQVSGLIILRMEPPIRQRLLKMMH